MRSCDRVGGVEAVAVRHFGGGAFVRRGDGRAVAGGTRVGRVDAVGLAAGRRPTGRFGVQADVGDGGVDGLLRVDPLQFGDLAGDLRGDLLRRVRLLLGGRLEFRPPLRGGRAVLRGDAALPLLAALRAGAGPAGGPHLGGRDRPAGVGADDAGGRRLGGLRRGGFEGSGRGLREVVLRAPAFQQIAGGLRPGGGVGRRGEGRAAGGALQRLAVRGDPRGHVRVALLTVHPCPFAAGVLPCGSGSVAGRLQKLQDGLPRRRAALRRVAPAKAGEPESRRSVRLSAAFAGRSTFKP